MKTLGWAALTFVASFAVFWTMFTILRWVSE